MVWLFLDTHERGMYRLGTYDSSGQTAIRMYKGRTRSLLNRLERLREKTGSTWEGVAVVAGPGSFSSIRTGVLYANLLAYTLKLPLQGLTIEQSQATTTWTHLLGSLSTASVVSYIAPIYDAEPNITIPRTPTHDLT